jgi:hypothetical protein
VSESFTKCNHINCRYASFCFASTYDDPPFEKTALERTQCVGIPYRNSGFNIERLARLLDRLKFSTSTHCLLSVTYESCLPLFPEFPHAGVDCALNGIPIGRLNPAENRRPSRNEKMPPRRSSGNGTGRQCQRSINPTNTNTLSRSGLRFHCCSSGLVVWPSHIRAA